jgi:hypothetical protein
MKTVSLISIQQNIAQHIENIYKDKELQKNPTHKNFLLVQLEGSPLFPVFGLCRIAGYFSKSNVYAGMDYLFR